jgi:hypothetical protein
MSRECAVHWRGRAGRRAGRREEGWVGLGFQERGLRQIGLSDLTLQVPRASSMTQHGSISASPWNSAQAPWTLGAECCPSPSFRCAASGECLGHPGGPRPPPTCKAFHKQNSWLGSPTPPPSAGPQESRKHTDLDISS